MAVSITGMIIGALVAAFGLYYLCKEKQDRELKFGAIISASVSS